MDAATGLAWWQSRALARFLLDVLFVQPHVGVEGMELIRLAWGLNDLTCQATGLLVILVLIVRCPALGP